MAKGDVATLRFLALGETALGPKGGIALAEILRDGSCAGLERLSLPGAGLGAEGVEAVCAALPPKLQRSISDPTDVEIRALKLSGKR